MKKILSLIIFFIISISLTAQNWTKKMQKDFKRSNDVAVVVDFPSTVICGVSYNDFPSYYAGRYHSNEQYPIMLLQKFRNAFKTAFYQYHRLPGCYLSDAKYVVHYEFLEITDQGGWLGQCYIMSNGNKSVVNEFVQEDGKWNDLEKLLMENIDEFFKHHYIYSDQWYK